MARLKDLTRGKTAKGILLSSLSFIDDIEWCGIIAIAMHPRTSFICPANPPQG